MTDIVARLRQIPEHPAYQLIVHEAADEIERLRELLQAARGILQHHKATYPDEIDEALANALPTMHEAADKIERLRRDLRALRQDNGAVITQLQNDIRELRAALATCRELREYDAKTIKELRSGNPNNPTQHP